MIYKSQMNSTRDENELYIINNQIPPNFYKFSTFNCRIVDLSFIHTLPIYIKYSQYNHNRHYYSNIIMYQKNSIHTARYYKRFRFTQSLEELLQDPERYDHYRLQIDFYPNENNVKFTVFITKSFLNKLYNKTKVPKFIYTLIRNSVFIKQTISKKNVSVIKVTNHKNNRKLNSLYKTKLYPYQIDNINWMLNKEISIDNDFKYDTFMIPYGSVYFNIQSMNIGLILNENNKLINPETLQRVCIKPKGGILADEVGLGKTLSCIGLIQEGLQRSNKTSLVICPRRLCKQWQNEITKFSGLKSIIISTIIQFRKYTTQQANNVDVVIISYSFLLNKKYIEFKEKFLQEQCTHLDSSDPLILSLYPWRRILLDEGHELTRNKRVNYSKNQFMNSYEENIFHEIYNLKSDYRWIISGTPYPDYRRKTLIQHFLYYDEVYQENVHVKNNPIQYIYE